MKKILFPVMGALLIIGSSCNGRSSESNKDGDVTKTEQTEKVESKDTESLITSLNELSGNLLEAKNSGQATQLMVEFNTKLNKYANSKEKISPAQRTALTEAFMGIMKSMITISVKGEDVDLDDSKVKEYVEGQLATIKEKFDTSTANAETLGEYIREGDRAMK